MTWLVQQITASGSRKRKVPNIIVDTRELAVAEVDRQVKLANATPRTYTYYASPTDYVVIYENRLGHNRTVVAVKL